jgi:hypothetical protein
MTFAIDQIEKAWREYDDAKAMRYLVNGKWEHIIIFPGKVLPRIEATRAEMVPLYKVMTFPEYLRSL